jgi:hypothetical protein
VYGLWIEGVPDVARQAFVEVPVDAPKVDVEVVLGCSVAAAVECDDEHVSLATEGGSRCDIRRNPASATLTLPEEPSPQALVHPLLTTIASAHNRWRGALTLHGGAFLGRDGVWAVLADKDTGKSSTMAGLAARGVTVFADDLVVVLDGDVYPGPRSIDLRPDAAARFDGSEYIGYVGRRHRHRIKLGPAPVRAPLVGVVTLAWANDGHVDVSPLGVPERLRALTRSEALVLMGEQPASLLFDTMRVAMYRLSRPRSWDHHERAIDALMELSSARSHSG